VATAARNAEVKRYIEAEMQEVCNSKVARYQTIKKIKILPTTFSVDGGELTPTLKVKRNIVNEKYASEIAAFYAEGTPATQAARA
jgi:long-subunit acyl-CoA synthetase (AMP-forming)